MDDVRKNKIQQLRLCTEYLSTSINMLDGRTNVSEITNSRVSVHVMRKRNSPNGAPLFNPFLARHSCYTLISYMAFLMEAYKVSCGSLLLSGLATYLESSYPGAMGSQIVQLLTHIVDGRSGLDLDKPRF